MTYYEDYGFNQTARNIPLHIMVRSEDWEPEHKRHIAILRLLNEAKINLRQEFGDSAPKTVFPIEIHAECGCRLVISNPDGMPLHTVECPHGPMIEISETC